jgi:hypothetical protein
MEQFSISGPIFGPSNASGSYQVFVHYAGPVMLIGFSPDVSSWNCMSPILADERVDDENTHFVPYISEKAIIKIKFQHISAKFNYSPIAFNNYHPENLELDGFNDAIEDLGFIKADFTAPKIQENLIEPTSINLKLAQNRLLDARFEDFISLSEAAMYYGDWRRIESYGNELNYVG